MGQKIRHHLCIGKFIYKILVGPLMSDATDYVEKFNQPGMNLGALAADVHYLTELEVSIFGDKWKKVPCGDGTYAQILKNPMEAFPMYAKEWDISIKALINIVDSLKVEPDVQVKNKIIALFDGLTSMDNTVRMAYLNAYITFSSKPCDSKNQDYKMKMDSKINAAAALLASLKMLIDLSKDQIKDKIDTVIQEFLSLSKEIARILSS